MDLQPQERLCEVVEASTIGLAPGVWPATLEFEGVKLRRGKKNCNGLGELCSVTYSNEWVELEVLND